MNKVLDDVSWYSILVITPEPLHHEHDIGWRARDARPPAALALGTDKLRRALFEEGAYGL